MTELTIFVADDGTRFEDEDECLEYEANKFKNDLIFYDDDMNVLPWNKWEDAKFINVKQKEAFDAHEQIYGDLGINGVKGVGLYYWDEIYDTYREIVKVKDEYGEIIDKVSYFENMILTQDLMKHVHY